MKALLAFSSVLVMALVAVGPAQTNDLGIFTNQESVGQTPPGGIAHYDSAKGEYRITGGGANVWGTSDAFLLRVEEGVWGYDPFCRRTVGRHEQRRTSQGSAHDTAESGAGIGLCGRGVSWERTYVPAVSRRGQ